MTRSGSDAGDTSDASLHRVAPRLLSFMFEYAGVLETTAEGEEGSELQLLVPWPLRLYINLVECYFEMSFRGSRKPAPSPGWLAVAGHQGSGRGRTPKPDALKPQKIGSLMLCGNNLLHMEAFC